MITGKSGGGSRHLVGDLHRHRFVKYEQDMRVDTSRGCPAKEPAMPLSQLPVLLSAWFTDIDAGITTEFRPAYNALWAALRQFNLTGPYPPLSAATRPVGG
jgi:hypothetical protein